MAERGAWRHTSDRVLQRVVGTIWTSRLLTTTPANSRQTGDDSLGRLLRRPAAGSRRVEPVARRYSACLGIPALGGALLLCEAALLDRGVDCGQHFQRKKRTFPACSVTLRLANSPSPCREDTHCESREYSFTSRLISFTSESRAISAVARNAWHHCR